MSVATILRLPLLTLRDRRAWIATSSIARAANDPECPFYRSCASMFHLVSKPYSVADLEQQI